MPPKEKRMRILRTGIVVGLLFAFPALPVGEPLATKPPRFAPLTYEQLNVYQASGRADPEGVERRAGWPLQSPAPQPRDGPENVRPALLPSLELVASFTAERDGNPHHRAAVAVPGRVVRARAARDQGGALAGNRGRAQSAKAPDEHEARRGGRLRFRHGAFDEASSH